MQISKRSALLLGVIMGTAHAQSPIGLYQGHGEVVLHTDGFLTIFAGERGSTRIGVQFDASSIINADTMRGEESDIRFEGWLTVAPDGHNGVSIAIDPMVAGDPNDWVIPQWAADALVDVTNGNSWQQFKSNLDADRDAWLAVRRPFRGSFMLGADDEPVQNRLRAVDGPVNWAEALSFVNRNRVGIGGNGLAAQLADNDVKSCPGGSCKCEVEGASAEACCPKGFAPSCQCVGKKGDEPAHGDAACIKILHLTDGDFDF